MLSERNKALYERERRRWSSDWKGRPWARQAETQHMRHISEDMLNRLLDAARAEGGAASGLAAGSHPGSSPQPREDQ